MRNAFPGLLAALALGLAACGGGDEDEIRELVAAFYANEEGVCDRITDNLLEQEFESREDCEAQAEDADPQEGWEIEDVSTEGDEGEVDVRVDDQRGTLLVRREDGEWKIDGVRARDGEVQPPAETVPELPPETPEAPEAPEAPDTTPDVPGVGPEE